MAGVFGWLMTFWLGGSPIFAQGASGTMVVPPKEVERIARQYLMTHLPWKPEQVKALDISVSLNEDLLLPQGKLGYEVGGLGDLSRSTSFSFYILITINGEAQKRVWVRGRVQAVSSVVVSKVALKRNQVIAEEDLSLEERESGDIDDDALRDMAAAVGKRVRRTLRVNEILRSSYLEQLPLVKRGDLVTIVAESASLKIIAQGKALENGAKGEVIRVLNRSSKKEVLGRVGDTTTIFVDF